MNMIVPIARSFAHCISDFASVFAAISETTFVPKHLHTGPKIVEIATYLSVIIFNEGFVGVLKVLTTIECPLVPQAQTYVQKRDKTRNSRSNEAVQQE
ncbi:hypothetical protein TNCV_771561 [Trichonephila clavipes]|nr:hypothetical protein TNCV_771561 [Trichonephila clavipes]